MSSLAIVAKTRKDEGKGAVRRLRKTGQIPAVVYGGEIDPISIELRHDDIWHSLENEAFYSSILSLELDGKAEKVVLRDVYRHPAKPNILHVDFQRVSSKSEITMSVPIHYLNAEDSPGVKLGGMVDVLFTELSIRCLAKDLPESIEVNVIEMNIGDSISFTDIKLPKGVDISIFAGMSEEEIITHDQTIFSIQEARATIEPEEIESESAESDSEETASKKPEEEG